MKTPGPTLIDIISPPPNPWLQTILAAKTDDVPPWVHVVRFDNKDDDDDDMAPPAHREVRSPGGAPGAVRRRA